MRPLVHRKGIALLLALAAVAALWCAAWAARNGVVIAMKRGNALGQYALPAPRLVEPDGIGGGLAVAAAGDIFIGDAYYGRISRFSPGGMLTGSFTLAKTKSNLHGFPWGVAVDGQGGIWASNPWNGKIVRFLPNGAITATIDSVGGDIAVDAQGRLFEAAEEQCRVIVWSAKGEKMREWVVLNGEDRPFWPAAVAVGPDGLVYVAALGHGTGKEVHPAILVYDNGGHLQRGFASSWPAGVADAELSTTDWSLPLATDLAADGRGNIFLTAPNVGVCKISAKTGKLLGVMRGAAQGRARLATTSDGTLYVLTVTSKGAQVTAYGAGSPQWGSPALTTVAP